jgi:hypothetical protein
MPDETDVVTTADTQAVIGDAVPATPAAPTVSTQPPTPPQPVTATRPSDPEARIRNLQSELDRTRANLNALTLEKATLMNQVETTATERETAIATAAEATRMAMTKSQTLEQENATLKAEATRLTFILAHPDLAPYAKLIPSTTDEGQLNAVAAEIINARNADIEALRTQVRTAGAPPPANPARPTGTLSAQEIDRQLKDALRDPKRFEQTLKELASRVSQQT